MKVTFDKEKLLQAITPAASISQVKNTLTSVEGLLFECPADEKRGKIEEDDVNMTRISAYDLEKGLRTTVECKIFEEGNYVINASNILQIVRKMPDGEITLEVDDKMRATISGGQSSFEISVSAGEEFPAMPMFIGDRHYTFPQYVLRNLINGVIFAVAQNDQRPFLNGALMKVKDGKITLVGCDGNRLSLASWDLDEDAPEAEVIIPGKFLSELSRLLRDTEEETTVIIGRKHIIFKIGSIYFFTRVIESQYLAYEKILQNKKYNTEAYVNPVELREALDRTSIISEDKLGGNSRSIVQMKFEGREIGITCVSSRGSNREKVTAAIGGAGLTIGFTGRLLLDALNAIPETESRIRLRMISDEQGMFIESSTGSRFMTFEGEDPKEKKDEEKFDYLHYVMPRRLINRV